MRIAVIGFSGSGKSTLSKALGHKYRLPVLHMDCLHFRKNWQERSREEELFILQPYLDNPDWVIDGNYGSLLYQERMELADQIILLQFPRLVCLRQAYGRYRKNKGQVRNSMAPGCVEKFDWAFVRWILWDGRKSAIRRQHRALLEKWPHKMTVCRNRQDVEALLARELNQSGPFR